MNNIATSLLGRKIQNYGADGIITTVFVDRGVAKALVTNPDNCLYVVELEGCTLVKEE